MAHEPQDHFEHGDRRPDTNRPLNAPGRRPTVGPALAVVGLVVVVFIVFAIITYLQSNT